MRCNRHGYGRIPTLPAVGVIRELVLYHSQRQVTETKVTRTTLNYLDHVQTLQSQDKESANCTRSLLAASWWRTRLREVDRGFVRHPAAEPGPEGHRQHIIPGNDQTIAGDW